MPSIRPNPRARVVAAPLPLPSPSPSLAMIAATLVVLALMLAAAPRLAAASEDAPKPATLSLTGEGKVSARPDMATITTGVTSEAKTAREALSKNTAAMSRVIDAVKAAGIAAKDIATSDFSVRPQYLEYRPKDGELRRPPQIVGYRVSNQATVKVRDLDTLGPLLDALVGEGSNQIGGIAFGLSNMDELMNEARRAAIKTVVAKAELYAEAGGFSLKRIVTISEQSGIYPPPRFRAMANVAMAAEAAVPIEAGEQEISVTVAAEWEIAQ